MNRQQQQQQQHRNNPLLDTGQVMQPTQSTLGINVAQPTTIQPILSPATFLEPPQYLTAISVQPVIATRTPFTTANATVISPIQVSELY